MHAAHIGKENNSIFSFSCRYNISYSHSNCMSGWPSGLRRCVQVAVHYCGRGFESHFWHLFVFSFSHVALFLFIRLESFNMHWHYADFAKKRSAQNLATSSLACADKGVKNERLNYSSVSERHALSLGEISINDLCSRYVFSTVTWAWWIAFQDIYLRSFDILNRIVTVSIQDFKNILFPMLKY